MHPLHTNNKRISAFCIFNGSFLLLLNFFLLELLPNIFHQRKKRILNCKIKLTCFFSFYEFTDALHQIRSILDRWLQRKYLKTILKTTIDSARGRQTMITSLCPFTEKTIHRCTQNQNYLSEPTHSQPYTTLT